MEDDDQVDAYPQSMEDALALMGRARAELLAVVGPLSDAEIAALGPEGWSVKDHLAHLSVWERSLVALLTRQDRATAMGLETDLWRRHEGAAAALDPEEWKRHEYEAINEAIRARWADATRADVMSALAASRRAILDTLDAMTFADLMRPYADYVPGSAEQDPIAYWLAGNSYLHDDEHRGYIEGLLGRRFQV